jgi:hypothetical protein
MRGEEFPFDEFTNWIKEEVATLPDLKTLLSETDCV